MCSVSPRNGQQLTLSLTAALVTVLTVLTSDSCRQTDRQTCTQTNRQKYLLLFRAGCESTAFHDCCVMISRLLITNFDIIVE